jgi:predicted nucleic acid-binding protein
MSILVDTNVLVYLYDEASPFKQIQARLALGAFAEAGRAVVTTQVLSEFFYTIATRLRPRMSPANALAELERHARIWTVLEVTSAAILTGARAVRDHKLNFWDAQLWATARLNGVRAILSEDFNSGGSLEGVRFVNPFAPGFNASDWLF